MAGHAAPGRGREAAGGDTSSAATPGRRDGVGCGKVELDWGRELGKAGGGGSNAGGAAAVGDSAACSTVRSGGGGETQTRDRHPSYSASGAGYDGTAPSRFGANAQRTPPRAYTFSPPPGYTTSYKKNWAGAGPTG
jgi:hypothetical protein